MPEVRKPNLRLRYGNFREVAQDIARIRDFVGEGGEGIPGPPGPPGQGFNWIPVWHTERYDEFNNWYTPNLGELLVFPDVLAEITYRIRLPEATDENEGSQICLKNLSVNMVLRAQFFEVGSLNSFQTIDGYSDLVLYTVPSTEPSFKAITFTSVGPSNQIFNPTGGWIHISDTEYTVVFEPLGAGEPSSGMPVGASMPWWRNELPQWGDEKWVWCDGKQYRGDDHPVAANILGVDSSGYLKVPDVRGRVIAGLDNMGGTSADRVTHPQADVLGGTFGTENVNCC